MMITTTFSFDGYRIKEYKGVVRGIKTGRTRMGESR